MHRLRRTASPKETSREFQGLQLRIEHPKGSTRTGVGPDGKEWSRPMHADYGYVADTTTSADGEPLDVYVGPDKDAPTAYVVEQLKEDGEFDEYKIVLGCDSEDEAEALYRKHYPDDWDRVADVWPIEVSRLGELVEKSIPKQAVTLTIRHPETGKRISFADWMRDGDEAPEIEGKAGPSHFLTEAEVRDFAHR